MLTTTQKLEEAKNGFYPRACRRSAEWPGQYLEFSSNETDFRCLFSKTVVLINKVCGDLL